MVALRHQHSKLGYCFPGATDNIATVAGQAARTITSTGQTNTNGSNISATLPLQTVPGESGAKLPDHKWCGYLSITTGSQDAGFSDVSVELGTGLAGTGGSSTFSLKSDGAVFQVGANDGQKVGLAIRGAGAEELGRNVSGSGSS